LIFVGIIHITHDTSIRPCDLHLGDSGAGFSVQGLTTTIASRVRQFHLSFLPQWFWERVLQDEWHQLLMGRMPFYHPTNGVKALKEIRFHD